MPMQIDDLRLMITRPLGLNVGGTNATTTQLDLYLNRAFWEIQNKFPFREKEVISTFNTVIGVRNYDVSFPTEAVKHIAIRENTDENNHYPLEQITRDKYEQMYRDNPNQQDIPVQYVREGCIIRLFPTPDDIYEITIERLVALIDLSAVNVAANIPQVWDEIIGLGGLWRACIDIGDINKANYFKVLQNDMINTIVPTEVNETQSNSQLARVEVLGLEY